FRPDQFGQQSGVVPGAGADLQDPFAGLRVELVEHHGHDGGHGDTAGRPVGAGFDGNGLVGVGVLCGGFGDEPMPGNGSQGVLDSWRAEVACGPDAVNHTVAQLFGTCTGCVGHRGPSGSVVVTGAVVNRQASHQEAGEEGETGCSPPWWTSMAPTVPSSRPLWSGVSGRYGQRRLQSS